MINLHNITLTYPDGAETLTAIDGAQLTVQPGQVAAITGPSGSGKSSLLAVAATLITPQRGTVTIDGIQVASLDQRGAARLRRERIGTVFQQSNLLPSLTAIEQLQVMTHLGASARTHRSKDTRAKAAELLATVGLEGKEGKRPSELSGGQRQRINIARALMNDPSVLIVDEPTSALDQERGAAIIDLILDMTAQRNTATLLVTHDRSHLPRMDQVHTMIDGILIEASETAVVSA